MTGGRALPAMRESRSIEQLTPSESHHGRIRPGAGRSARDCPSTAAGAILAVSVVAARLALCAAAPPHPVRRRLYELRPSADDRLLGAAGAGDRSRLHLVRL